jgi:hypothetical protein
VSERSEYSLSDVRKIPPVSMRQHTSAYVSTRQHTSAYVSVRHTSAYVSIRQHTSAYVSIRQHTFSVGERSEFSVSKCAA